MTQAVIYDSERTYRELRAVEVELTFPVRKVSPVKIDKFISVPSFIIDDLTAYKGKMVLVTQFPEVFSRKLDWPVFDSISAGLTSGEKRFLVHAGLGCPSASMVSIYTLIAKDWDGKLGIEDPWSCLGTG